MALVFSPSLLEKLSGESALSAVHGGCVQGATATGHQGLTGGRRPDRALSGGSVQSIATCADHGRLVCVAELLCPRFRMADRPDLYMWDTMEVSTLIFLSKFQA